VKPSWKGFIPEQEANYIQLLLGHNRPERKEVGLERLCKLYRSGYRLKSPHSIQQTLSGLLYSASPKVRRWTLNAIALVGSKSINLIATLEAINRDRLDDDILGAGIAALISLTRPGDILQLLKDIDVPLEGVTLLAACQQTDAFNAEVATHRVNPDQASAPELRMAAVLVGLDKAPEHLFSLNHPNSLVIGSLNEHNDCLVAQYSVWAICENTTLSLSHLGTRLKDVESRPDNVRGWIFQLIASKGRDAEKHREYLLLGSEDPSERARLGLAIGLVPTYFDGLEEITIDWFGSEECDAVRSSLLDHMASNSERCPAYCEVVIDAYRSENTGSLARARLEAAAQRTPLFGDLRRIALQNETLSLFAERPSTKGGVTIVNGNLNVGVMAGGDVTVGGDVNTTQYSVKQAQEELTRLAALLQSSKEGEVPEGVKLNDEALKKPIQTTVQKVLDWMKMIKEAGGYVVAGSAVFGEIFDRLSHLLAHLPKG
jgi:hypothetical protein